MTPTKSKTNLLANKKENLSKNTSKKELVTTVKPNKTITNEEKRQINLSEILGNPTTNEKVIKDELLTQSKDPLSLSGFEEKQADNQQQEEQKQNEKVIEEKKIDIVEELEERWAAIAK